MAELVGGVSLMSGVNLPRRVGTVFLGAALVTVFAASFAASASAQSLFGGWFERDRSAFGQPASFGQAYPQTGQPTGASGDDEVAAALQRQIVPYPGKEPSGTVIIDTPHTFLYLTLGGGKAIRYGIGVGRKGFTWSGVERISRKSEWPDWIPPAEMIARQPYLPRWVGGGPGNPLGARALYLGNTDYRIHGTNAPASIGTQVSSGCIRLRNEDVIDLYRRVSVGTKVIVLPGDPRTIASAESANSQADGPIERGATHVMTTRISVGSRDIWVYPAGTAWNESLNSRALY
jgi:lipoprotein-anchoring transpeptidase ErfK/SrfK